MAERWPRSVSSLSTGAGSSSASSSADCDEDAASAARFPAQGSPFVAGPPGVAWACAAATCEVGSFWGSAPGDGPRGGDCHFQHPICAKT